jgi:hypothetical protein
LERWSFEPIIIIILSLKSIVTLESVKVLILTIILPSAEIELVLILILDLILSCLAEVEVSRVLITLKLV